MVMDDPPPQGSDISNESNGSRNGAEDGKSEQEARTHKRERLFEKITIIFATMQ